jgi:hypothetical protein
MSAERGPVSRTTPIPPRPGGCGDGDDRVVGREHSGLPPEGGRDNGEPQFPPSGGIRYFFEMMTVFRNASPMLSTTSTDPPRR